MKTKILVSSAVILASTMSLALADPKEELTAAITKLTEADSYAWTAKTRSAGSGVSEISGKATKDGLIHYSITLREKTFQMIQKGDQSAMRGDDGWRTLEEQEADDRRRGRGTDWVSNIKLPAAEAMEILGLIGEIKMEDGAYTAVLSEDVIREVSPIGFRAPRRAGGKRRGPVFKEASGKVIFWVQDGGLSKMSATIRSTMNRNGEDRTFEETSTVEFSGVGETEIDLPEEVKAKVES